MPIGKETWMESDGQAVDVRLTSSVEANQVAYIEGFLGITMRSGNSGDYIALAVDEREYQFSVPAALNPVKGDTVFIDVTDLTGHIPDSTAYYTATGANRIALFKCTRTAVATADATTDIVTGILLVQ